MSFNGQEIITHVQQELDTVERRQPHRYRHGQKVNHRLEEDRFHRAIRFQILHDNHNLDQTFKTRYEVSVIILVDTGILSIFLLFRPIYALETVVNNA